MLLIRFDTLHLENLLANCRSVKGGCDVPLGFVLQDILRSLERGADRNVFCAAFLGGYLEIVKIMLQGGADVDALQAVTLGS
jgi:hypothetical protein